MAAAIQFCLSQAVRADWETEQISDFQMGRLVIGDAGDGVYRLFALKAGNISEGRVFAFTRADGEWKQSLIFSSSIQGSELSLGKACGSKASLLIGSGDLGVTQITPSAASWKTRTLRDAVYPGQDDLRYALPDIQTLQTDHGLISTMQDSAISVPGLECSNGQWGANPFEYVISKHAHESGSWSSKSPKIRDYYRILASGALRGDGILRYYGIQSGLGRFFELTPAPGNWKLNFLSDRIASLSPYFVIGDGRGDGINGLYAVSGAGPVEFRWKDTKWEAAKLPGRDSSSGILIGRFRPDKKPRIYVGSGRHIDEFTFERSNWRRERISPEKGHIDHFVGGKVSGAEPSPYFSIQNSKGLYRLKWTEGERVVVAGFVSDGVSPQEASASSDLFRIKLLNIGNCTVLEREQMDRILAEHELQQSPAASREYAVRLGRLLGASRVIVGTVSRLFGSRIISMNSVSVASGVIERAEYRQCAAGDCADRMMDELAQSICPARHTEPGGER